MPGGDRLPGSLVVSVVIREDSIQSELQNREAF